MANIGTLSICSLLLSALALPNALAAGIDDQHRLERRAEMSDVDRLRARHQRVFGDIVIIETVSGPDPEEVDSSGVVPPSAVPEYVRTIRRDVTDRGPGGHILKGASGSNREAESTDAPERGGLPRSSDEAG